MQRSETPELETIPISAFMALQNMVISTELAIHRLETATSSGKQV